jgi:3-hydroxyisobutyrate dehydrogenase-like beta-hydroxyacid dehydrogenase
MAADRIGFIGVGNMGSGMAMRLVDSGFSLTVCDPNPAARARLTDIGARAAASVREVADSCEIVFASLPGLKISLDVALGAEGITKGSAIKVYVETSTLGTSTVNKIAQGLQPTGIDYMDCSVAGGPRGPAGVRDGLFTILTCGARHGFERARPALTALTKNMFYLGEKAGMAQLAKVINNHLSKAGKVAAFEGVTLGLKGGLDPKALIDFINLSSGKNATTMDKFPAAIFSGTFSHTGPLDKGMKDAELFLEEAKRLGSPTWLGPSVLAMYKEAAANGYEKLDSMLLIKYMEELAGVDQDQRLKQNPKVPK